MQRVFQEAMLLFSLHYKTGSSIQRIHYYFLAIQSCTKAGIIPQLQLLFTQEFFSSIQLEFLDLMVLDHWPQLLFIGELFVVTRRLIG